MGKGLKTDRIDTPKIVLLVMAELFTAASLVAVIMDGEWTRIALTAVTEEADFTVFLDRHSLFHRTHAGARI